MSDTTKDAVERFIQTTLKEAILSEGMPRNADDTADAYATVNLLRALSAQLATVTAERDAAQAEVERLRQKIEASNRKASEWLDAAFQRRDYAQDWLDNPANGNAPDAEWAANHDVVDGMLDRISMIHALFPDVPSDARAASATGGHP
jgi:hypothetical protein